MRLVSWMNGLDHYRPILSRLSMARPLEYRSVTCGISVDKRGVPDAVAGSLELGSAMFAVYFDQCFSRTPISDRCYQAMHATCSPARGASVRVPFNT